LSDDRIVELYKAHRDSVDKQTYFLLAAAGAAIGFAITQTKQLSLGWSQLPLGAAILCWGASFFSGCRHVSWTAAATRANLDLLVVRAGQSEIAGRDATKILYSAEILTEIIGKNATKASSLSRWQFRFLIAGALFYIAWHVLEMAIRGRLIASF
jgi:hypothetical protein